MQPYQEASKEINRQQEAPGRFIKKAGEAALGVAGIGLAGKFASKVLPFLSNYVPEAIAIKGLSKINPTLGKFIAASMNQGHSFENLKDFMIEKIEGDEEQENAKENRNIIEKYSPELFQFLDQDVRNGRDPIQAGAVAQNDKRFSEIIKKITKDHKTPWSSILESVFGLENRRQKGLQKFNEKGKQPGIREQETERFQQGYGNNINTGQPNDALKQALITGDAQAVSQYLKVNDKQANNIIQKFNQGQGNQQQGQGKDMLRQVVEKIMSL